MSDLQRDWPRGLPHVDGVPTFLPPDPSELLRNGRHVRRMHAMMAGAGAMAVAVAAVVVGLNTSANRADRLHVVTPATNRSATPAPNGANHASRAGDAVVAPPQSGTAKVAGSAPVLVPGPATTPGTTSAPKAAQPPPGPGVPTTATPFRRTTVTNPPRTSCLYQPITAPSGWCLDYIGPESTPAGRPVDLAVDICRINGLGTGTLRFHDAQEAEIQVLSSGTRNWRWSHGRSFAATPHTLAVAAGQCLRWTTTWSTEDNSGRAFQPGTYSLGVDVVSPDKDLPNSGASTGTTLNLT
jgi:hypothetical protein